MEKKLLIYGFEKNGNKYNIIFNTAKKYDIEVKEIDKEDLNHKVGYLMGLADFKKSDDKTDNDINMEFLLFSDFDRSILINYLKDLKEKGVSIPHKSVITETTKNWKFSYLLKHIEEEHRVMEKFNELGKYVKRAREILETEKNEEMEFAVKSAMELTQKSDITEKDVDEKFEIFKGLREFEKLIK